MAKAPPFAKRVSVPSSVMFRELEGESVLLHVDSETYFGLDDIGTRMWQALTTSDSIESAFEALPEQYDVQPEALREDLVELLEKLLDKGLLEIDGG